MTTPTWDFGFAALKMVGGLFLVLALLFVLLYLLKRYGHKAGLTRHLPADLKLVGQMALGSRKSVVVVRYLNKDMVLGVTDSSITLLTETHHDTEQANFSKHLEQSRAKGG
ncbi:flagellar biosynthetic protein FliO [Desulfonatronum sp. SC1]|uniref:flagellar biosynthetic protein FliO n=1 Tax=Desulfonatronum sp. SC1 TaxID=2109626 RepID=UPI000D306601|nr:flagellar biosynthetic protein FliO [Desulfonatronum sp. SC1]PTN32010.1 flagellar biosynthetic protein FliO [Desulfonatronum sp. SC1]